MWYDFMYYVIYYLIHYYIMSHKLLVKVVLFMYFLHFMPANDKALVPFSGLVFAFTGSLCLYPENIDRSLSLRSRHNMHSTWLSSKDGVFSHELTVCGKIW